MTDTNKKRPTGLIKNTKITPNQSADNVQIIKKQTRKSKKSCCKKPRR
ncbi:MULTISPECIES: hypothetical protein [Enterococcus]|nr:MULTISPECIES: hypothetical protein [Enterococcus]MEC3942686.1 hypothetical protein [Enterococcus mundtii]